MYLLTSSILNNKIDRFKGKVICKSINLRNKNSKIDAAFRLYEDYKEKVVNNILDVSISGGESKPDNISYKVPLNYPLREARKFYEFKSEYKPELTISESNV